jgi:acyl-coenzyme A synthetase/AMP-(fatty) acid ligase
MQQLLDTPLMAATRHLDRLAVVDGARLWTWRQVHAAALGLAGDLPEGGVILNLCDSRAGFLVAWLAALRRRSVQLLPPSGGRADLSTMLASSADAVIVVDRPDALQPYGSEHARCLVHVRDPGSAVASDGELAWAPDWDAPLVRLYTSGSTGTPQAHVKTLGHLAQGARVLASRLEDCVDGGLAAVRQIVCSVAPQHMFGLEASVMLPLVAGMAVVEGRPLLPADVRSAFQGCADAAAWVATPLHLRAIVQSGESVANCRAAIVSTMPLAPTLAANAEPLIGAPVLEIYGSTETGVVAMRRTARDARWRPVGDVRLEAEAHGTRAWGGHFLSPQTLSDQMEFDRHGHFSLLGRAGDMIKIAGRRASLAGLNLLLQDLPGLVDGVFYLPATGAPTERMVLIAAEPTPDRPMVEAWLRERIDPVFLPRAIIVVRRLPRSDGGKLPRAALDEIYTAWLAQRAAER